jgi:hypothetical protein
MKSGAIEAEICAQRVQTLSRSKHYPASSYVSKVRSPSKQIGAVLSESISAQFVD